MKILQRNLNRSTFVVWEIKRNVSVVCVCSAPNCCDTEQPSASQPASLFPAWRASLLWPPRSPDLKPPYYFLCGYLKGRVYQKQTTNHRRLESKHHRRNSGSDSGRTGKHFPKYGAPVSILFGRKWWPLPVHVMVSSHLLHKEVSPLQISLQYPQ